MRQKGIAHLFFLVVVVVIAIGAVGYLAYQNAQLKKQDEETVVTPKTTDVQASPTTTMGNLTPTPDPTANWKAYENIKFNYQIKYPSDWIAKSIEPGPPAFDLVNNSRGIITYPNIYSGVSDARTYITIETDGPQNLAYPSYEEWLASASTSKFYTIVSSTQETFADVPATVITGSYDGYGFPATIKTIHFKSLDSNTYFSIVITNEKEGARQNTVNQILSTLKFTE